jgi:Omp85 superfamily domain/Calcineurin-like phosphoesterase
MRNGQARLAERRTALAAVLSWRGAGALVALSLLTPSLGQAQTPIQTPTEGRGADAVHHVYLIGDTGGFDPHLESTVLVDLTARLSAHGSGATVVFLGDNIYGRGLPDSAHVDRALAEARLVQQLDAVKDTGARVVFVPGNHDWDRSGPLGLESILRQEAFVEAYLGRPESWLPEGGLPGPETIEIADGIELVVIDTEWWLRTQDKPFGDSGRYETREEADLIANLADVLRRKDDSRLLVVGHHPMFSNGPHGGHLSLKEHLFPLTEIWDNAYIPLPLIGSLYPLIRGFAGGRQDMSGQRYRSLQSALTGLFESFDAPLIYASGHDHSLQHFPVGKVDYLVSGSASRPEFVAEGRGADFTTSEPGFLELEYRKDGSTVLRALTPEGIIHESVIQAPAPTGTALPRIQNETREAADTSFTGAAASELRAGPFKRFFLGQAHRPAWTTPVTIPVLDVDRIAGGIRPIQRGGGQQTVSVRLENEAGHQFVLRSMDKDPTLTLPAELRATVARDVVLDQVSILHPYGALLVPPLAHAVGIYYATPQVFFVPDDPRLAPYSDILGSRMMMLEERPADDMSHAPQFGSTEKVVGATRMYSEIKADNDHRVDPFFFARSRVLDMLISDWDRHEDQWRWASFEPPDQKGKIYRSIPRDRDWAFNRMNGLFPTMVQSEIVLPKFQEFKAEYDYIPGLNSNGFRQDRRLTSALTPEDWIAIADSVAEALTDSVFAESLSRWPPEINEIYGREYAEVFRSRRDQLSDAVAEYTTYLDQYVDVVMSDKHEEFVVEAAPNGSAVLSVYKTTKKGERSKLLFRRTFYPGRTKEVHLYGMGGTDRFEIKETGSRIAFAVIGGTGDDEFDGSRDTPNTVSVYDTKGGITIRGSGKAQLKLSEDPLVNRYDPAVFRLNTVLASVMIGANGDDGLFLGGGPVFYRHGFRKLPHASRHRIRANSTSRFEAFNLAYDSEFIHVLGSWDVHIDAMVRSPNSFQNFFGLGNETLNVASREFYQARLAEYRLSGGLSLNLPGSSSIKIMSFIQLFDVSADPGRFITQAGISASSFDDQLYSGLQAEVSLDSRDNQVLPSRGLHWDTDFEMHAGLSKGSEVYGAFSTSASTYYSRTMGSPVTVGIRAGLRHLVGAFPFWDAATVGGRENLRGFRSTRFSGRTSFYQNLEARIRLVRFAGYLAQGQLGVVGFFDNGRVWTDGESSDEWHRGAGFGLWTSFFDATVLRATVGFSSEQRQFELSTGFLF